MTLLVVVMMVSCDETLAIDRGLVVIAQSFRTAILSMFCMKFGVGKTTPGQPQAVAQSGLDRCPRRIPDAVQQRCLGFGIAGFQQSAERSLRCSRTHALRSGPAKQDFTGATQPQGNLPSNAEHEP